MGWFLHHLITISAMIRSHAAALTAGLSQWKAPEKGCWGGTVPVLVLVLTLLSHLLVFADGDVPAPGLLDHPGKAVKFPLPHLLEQEELGGTGSAESGHPKPSPVAASHRQCPQGQGHPPTRGS